ncbi:MAG: 16S rRNA (cytidine(1402)-2'-O)-methyltransferase [Acidimicrobiales bacterium]
MSGPAGTLVVVGTPIGNLGDLSPRATNALADATIVLCEDTRRTRKLFSAIGVKTPRLVRLDRNNEADMSARVVATFAGEERVVLVSDAGMPAVSDPGAEVVRAAAAAGFAISVIPGPSAAVAAVAISGIPGNGFTFVGFLARKGTARLEALGRIASSPLTTVIYEAGNRVRATTVDLEAACGPGRVYVWARELTKVHEQVWRGTLGEAVLGFERAEVDERGEWVLLVGPNVDEVKPDVADKQVEDLLKRAVATGSSRRSAVDEVAAATGVKRRQVYEIALNLGEGVERLTS